jgi:hypothetical protein
MLHVYVYFYFSINLCNYRMYLFVYVLCICFRKSFVCICLFACSSKNLCGIAQLDGGYVTVCSTERTRAFSRVAWPDLGGQGCHINIFGSYKFQLLLNYI